MIQNNSFKNLFGKKTSTARIEEKFKNKSWREERTREKSILSAGENMNNAKGNSICSSPILLKTHLF